MNHMTRRGFVAAFAAAPLLPGLARADSGDVIKIIVGVPPGGTTDMMARLMGKELSEGLKVATVVENHPGASGIIGGALVAHAAPDGHTLLMDASSHATAPYLYRQMPFSTAKDLVPVALVASTPYVLAVHPKLGVSSVKELLALLKAHPGEYSYASSGPGTAQHLAAEMLKRQAGVKMTHVPYRGSGAAFPDVLAGRVPILFENIAVMTPYIRQGAMRALAVTSKSRVPFLPDVPTMEEAGVADFEVLGWFALWAPTHTPAQEIARLNTAVNESLKKPALLKKLASVGAEPMGGTPEQQARWEQVEEAKWGGLIRDLGITL